ncbi:hypothetical protein A3K71_05425 [archaeon RBG_16_50_20]|nr:MAG: hypothetical protein A3K71_05425 [archaeon RBG_16_50_20]
MGMVQRKGGPHPLEVPLASVYSIEHVRCYRWRAIITGSVLPAVLFTQHFLFLIISRVITSRSRSCRTSKTIYRVIAVCNRHRLDTWDSC